MYVHAVEAEADRPALFVGISILVTSQLQTGDEFPNRWENLE